MKISQARYIKFLKKVFFLLISGQTFEFIVVLNQSKPPTTKISETISSDRVDCDEIERGESPSCWINEKQQKIWRISRMWWNPQKQHPTLVNLKEGWRLGINWFFLLLGVRLGLIAKWEEEFGEEWLSSSFYSALFPPFMVSTHVSHFSSDFDILSFLSSFFGKDFLRIHNASHNTIHSQMRLI